MSTLLLPVAGLLISILTLVCFFTKESNKEKKSKLYAVILIFNIIYALFGTFTFIYGLVFEKVWLMELFEKLHMIMTLVMILLLGFYTLVGDYFSKIVNKTCIIVLSVIGVIFSFLTILSPINVGEPGNLVYGNGFAYSVILTCIVGFLLFDVVIATNNLLKNKNIEYVSSFIILILLYGIGLIFRGVFSGVVFENFVISFVLLVMYLTIENPYLKRISKLEKEKNKVEDNYNGKSQFLGNMSKEIRMPLNSIVGLTEDILTYREKLPNEVIEDINDISRASKSLIDIVDDILEFNDDEDKENEIVEVTYNFNDEIGSYLRNFDMNNKKANVTFTFNIADDIPYELIGDINHIKEAVSIVLNKAYELCEAGNVDFTAKCLNGKDGCELILKVQNTGKVKEIELSEIKFLIEKMNGKMSIHNQDDELLVLMHIPQKISNMSKFMKSSAENREEHYSNYGHRRILIVDDNLLNVKVISKALVEFGFEIDSVESGDECLDRIQGGYIYDLILMDIMMPGMSGEETFKKLKDIEDFNIPVFALTADAEVGAKARYVSQGFIDYIAKPFSRDQIKTRLDLIFGNNSDTSDLKEIPKYNRNIEVISDEEEIETI